MKENRHHLHAISLKSSYDKKVHTNVLISCSDSRYLIPKSLPDRKFQYSHSNFNLHSYNGSSNKRYRE